MYRIVHDEMQTPNVILPRFEASKIASRAHLGQLVIIRSDETGERIPMMIADLGRREWNKEYDHFLLKYNHIQAGSYDGERIGDQCCRLGTPARVEIVQNGYFALAAAFGIGSALLFIKYIK
jgi:ferredoxin/flavodoxin---NADP+ reductase